MSCRRCFAGWSSRTRLRIRSLASRSRATRRRQGLDVSRGFSEGEWLLIRTVADGLEWSHAWSEPAAQRIRFLLDFGYAIGLRASEHVGATLADIRGDEHCDHWLARARQRWQARQGGVAAACTDGTRPVSRAAGPPVTPARWNPVTPLVASIEEDDVGIETTRLWRVLRRFFALVANAIQDERPGTAEKLRRASPHWMRHTQAHALVRGAELIMVRDNLRHSSISTTRLSAQRRSAACPAVRSGFCRTRFQGVGRLRCSP
ncbi:hypothetical protein SAMN05192539_105715 [Paraburkholderia diazotrophica]|uniref:Phage integrase family protein n=1 Tax=Paraburkholderia diazotrophica TaxID=667676 RepID=A0A1H7EKY3_9BURK|nr:hypothetical protein SAMN05192539_105715 [Paraburkholderia diazotrophica]